MQDGTLFIAEGLKGSLLHTALKEMAAVRFSEGDGCVDIWVGAGLVVQWLPHSDVINLSSKVQMRLTAFSKLSIRSLVLAEVPPDSESFLSTLQQQAVMNLQLRLITVSTPVEAASFICQLLKLQHRPGLSPASHHQHTPNPAIMHLVQCLPNIGRVKAKALLTTFHSVSRIAAASEDELMNVIGQPAATAVHHFLHHPHTPPTLTDTHPHPH